MSIWIQGKVKDYPALNQDIDCDVLIIGGGMSGLCCAYHLKDEGMNIVLVEADKIGYGASGRSTGKVSSQHGFNYQKIYQKHGKEKTKRYYDLNQQAITGLKSIIDTYDLKCEWQDKISIVGCKAQNHAYKLKDEITAYEACQIPYIRHESEPYQVRFENQASFDPYAFMTQLATKLDIKIYEHSAYQSMKQHDVKVNHHTIHAKHIIFATQVLPFRFPLFYTTTQPLQTTLAALSDSDHSKEMSLTQDEISLTKNSYSNFMLVGGYEHAIMKKTETKWKELERYLKEMYPKHKIMKMWTSQDYKSFDHLPVIGKQDHYYVITGFNKWGNTLSYVAGKVIKDCILGKESPDISLFSPQRFSLAFNSSFITENAQVVKDYLGNKLNIPQFDYSKARQGAVMMINQHAYGFYEEDHILYMVDVKCPHLGCTLQFNSTEISWDCPCHGSRFDIEGRIMKGPAVESLHAERIYLKKDQKGR